MPEISAVFFDLGNTLRFVVKDEAHQLAAKQRIAELIGADEDPDTVYAQLNERYQGYRDWVFETMREAPDAELWTRWLVPELPAEKIAPLGEELTYQYRQASGNRVLGRGMEAVIQTLHQRGYILGIISNLIGTREIPEWLEKDGLAQYFKSVVLSSVLGIRKPDPAIYDHAAREIGVSPENCAYIGDNLNRDVTGTHAAGFGLSVIINQPEKLAQIEVTEDNQPNVVLHNFEDLLTLFPECPHINLDGLDE